MSKKKNKSDATIRTQVMEAMQDMPKMWPRQAK